MMYSEFLTLSGKTENYISYTEYTNEIEPIYTDCELSKADFIKLMDEAFEKIVYPAVEKAIHNLSMNIKEAYINHKISIDEQIGKVDRAARKIAYEYMKVFSKL